MKTIVLTTSSAKQLDALPRVIATEIEEALALYAVDGITVLAIYIGARATTTYR